MTRDWEDRDRSGRGYGRREDHGGRDRSRDWSDRAGDEVRSWLGDDDAERRRRMDEERDYGMGGSMSRGRYGDERGGYGGRSMGGSGFDPYGSGRGDYGSGRGDYDRRRDDYGRGDLYDPISSGMAGRGMGMTGASFGTSYGSRSSYDAGRDAGSRRYGQDSRDRSDRGFLDRAGDEIASWFGDEDAQRRREMDSGHRGRGPKNYSRSDDRIREDVSDRLSDDRHIDASDIEVSVSGGEVTLDGTVENRFAKRHAEDLAESCSGVSHVQNNLRVKDRRAGAGMTGSGAATGRSGMGSTGMGGTGGSAVGGTGTGLGSETGGTDAAKPGSSQS
ncbi:SWFGD domain-containing protein [Paracoccus fontiphilus]|uniref:SWFGD domain-containing protein n=1 Tax=Paracoccus fontiphilus TaxID=1815556 RepID=A0ABV7IC52_9RHOB